MTTVEDIYLLLGKWRDIIIIDLYNAFFQNHIHPEDQPYLGIVTSFGGLRVIVRSGQGLIGQSEKLDELMAKVLKKEMKEGVITKIQDNIIIGGDTQADSQELHLSIAQTGIS